MPKTIIVPAMEGWDELKEEFVSLPQQKLILEHSLISISKWESKFKIPFMDRKGTMSDKEFRYYVKCMTINGGVDKDTYYRLTTKNLIDIQDYIDDPMTATKIYNWGKNDSHNNSPVTSERIYSWMIQLNIPVELCEKWHLNRLMILIEVCSAKNEEPHKLTPKEIEELNMARRKKFHSKG